MKTIIILLGTLTFFANVAVAQQTKTPDKIKVKKDSCYMLEYDMIGNEIRFPCTIKHAKNNTLTNQIILSKEKEPATGFISYFKTDIDQNGAEIKRQVFLVREYDGAGNSTLYLQDIDAAGNQVLIPAKIKQ